MKKKWFAMFAIAMLAFAGAAFADDDDLPGEAVAVVGAPTQLVQQAPAAHIAFPSSMYPARGTPWRHMHEHGYQGSLAEGCGLMGLTGRQCSQIGANLDSCPVAEVRNGVVLDQLTFTRNGRSRSQRHVLVQLVSPPSRQARICNLGGGVYVGRFFTCANLFLVRTTPPAPRHAEYVPPPPAPTPCCEHVVAAVPPCCEAPPRVQCCEVAVRPAPPRECFVWTDGGMRGALVRVQVGTASYQLNVQPGIHRTTVPCRWAQQEADICFYYGTPQPWRIHQQVALYGIAHRAGLLSEKVIPVKDGGERAMQRPFPRRLPSHRPMMPPMGRMLPVMLNHLGM